MEMLDLNPTAPFGRRPLSLGVVETAQSVREFPPGQTVHKWKAFRALCEAKVPIGVSDRSLTVLNALLSFHPDTTLVSGAADLVVFPSNRLLAIRANGMAPSTLRRHIALLVDCRLILRRDSPNGKRYAHKRADGDIDQAFGFDLGPFVAYADKFAALAETVRADRAAVQRARQRIAILRRDISKMIATGADTNVARDLPAFVQRFSDIVGRLPSRPGRSVIEAAIEELAVLSQDLLQLLASHAQGAEISTTGSHFEHHIKSSDIEILSEAEQAPDDKCAITASSVERAHVPPMSFSLQTVLRACPDIVACAKHGIRHWPDFMATASLVRSMLGISVDAWSDACAVFGQVQASVIIAAILQRGTAIRNPGGYLRTLTRKAEGSGFSIERMLTTLLSTPTISARFRSIEPVCPSSGRQRDSIPWSGAA